MYKYIIIICFKKTQFLDIEFNSIASNKSALHFDSIR